MLYGLTLPPYKLVQEFEGKGNYAVKKYYQFPFNIFYLKKFRMILDMMGAFRVARIMDFGCGPARLLKQELTKRSFYPVTCIDEGDTISEKTKYDTIVCASVLEFTAVSITVEELRDALSPLGHLIVASPLDSWLSRFYFWIIGDKWPRRPNAYVLSTIYKYFDVIEYKEWFGLYFVLKAKHK